MGEPNRVWWFTRSIGTHTGQFGGSISPSGTRVEWPPQVNSMCFDSNGSVYRLTWDMLWTERWEILGAWGQCSDFSMLLETHCLSERLNHGSRPQNSFSLRRLCQSFAIC